MGENLNHGLTLKWNKWTLPPTYMNYWTFVCICNVSNLAKLSSHSIVLVDLNEFSSIFQKVQHSHSRHLKTTSNLLRINLKGILKFNEIWPLEGAMYITMG